MLRVKVYETRGFLIDAGVCVLHHVQLWFLLGLGTRALAEILRR